MVVSHDRPVRTPRRRRHGFGRFFKRWTVPVVGAVTPAMLIVVNIAAFIIHNLQAFRLIVAILAFISGLMLNSWMAVRALQYLHKRHPDSGLAEESNQELVIVGGMGIVILISAITAWFCYQGLASDRELPNPLTFIVGVASIVFPVVLRALFTRAIGPTSVATTPDPARLV